MIRLNEQQMVKQYFVFFNVKHLEEARSEMPAGADNLHLSRADICAFSVLHNRHCADICTICQKCQFEVRKG